MCAECQVSYVFGGYSTLDFMIFNGNTVKWEIVAL